MSQGGFFRCIQNSFDQNLITLEQRQWAENRFKELIRMVPTTKEAKEKLMLELAGQALEKERRALINENVRKNAVSTLTKYRNKYGQQDMAEGMVRFMESMEGKYKAELASIVSNLDQVFAEFRKGALTGDLKRMGGRLSDEGVMTTMANVRKELSGEKTKDEMAAKLAGSLREAIDRTRQIFNDLGGNIPKMENYDLPHQHDAARVLKAGRDPWVKFTFDLLDRERMLDLNGKPLNDADLKAMLNDVWATISTNGMIDLEPSMLPTGNGPLYKQHADRRVLQFKGADAWMTYAKQYGNIDLYAVAMSHFETMAKDITAMRFLGTNPPAMLNYLQQLVKKHVSTAGAIDKIREEQFARLQEIGTQRMAIISEVLQKEKPDLWDVQGIEMMRVTGDKLQLLHTRLNGIVTDIEYLRRFGDLRRQQSDMDKMALLTQQLDEVQRQLHAAQTLSEFDGLPNIPTGKMIELTKLGNEYNTILDEVRLDAIELDYKVLRATDRNVKKAMDMWGLFIGSANRVYDHRLANTAATIRNINVASKLGGAVITAISDLVTQRVTRKFLDMPNSDFVKLVGEIGGEVGKLNRAEAVRMHILLDDQTRVLRETAGNNAAFDATMWSSHLADRALAVTGLTQFTELEKRGFAKSFFADMGDHASLSYQKLPEAKRRLLQRNDISPVEWEQMRQSPSKPHPDSAPFLLPSDVQRTAGELAARKYAAMMYNERPYAVLEPTLEARSMLTLGTARGTWTGEFVRSAMQFKSFGATMVLLHGRRIMEEFAREGMLGSNVIRYGANLFLVGTLVGAVIVQLKDIIAGRDPRPMDNANFWFQAALQGGGFGIYGDFMQSSGNRFGQGLAATMAGPTLGQIENLSNMTIGNIKDAWNGKNTHLGSDFTKFVQGTTPFASTFYAKKILEGVFFDELEKRLNPHAYEAFRRRIDKRSKDYNGQQFYWAPGERGPSRAPNLGAVIQR